MGKTRAEKIQGMNLWPKVTLVALCTLLMTVFMYGGWVKPLPTQAGLMHSGASTGSTKYNSGTWGAGKTCNWCHNGDPNRFGNNIKFVLRNISTPTGVRPVTFNRITATSPQATDVLGNDARTTKTRSTNICEVCHHQTDFHQYSSVAKPTGKSVLATDHKNGQDCISCHSHNAGFFASCGSCHPSGGGLNTANPPGPTNATGGSSFPGAHSKHTGAPLSMACFTCHNNYTASPMGNNVIEMSFDIRQSNFNQFNANASVSYGTYSGGPVNAPYSWGGTAYRASTNSNATCNVYCHGGWPTSGATDRSWKNGPLPNCTTAAACHFYNGTSAPVTAGAHQKHLQLTGALTLTCTNCHPSSGYTNSHLSGNVNWAISGTGVNANTKYGAGATGNTTTIAPSTSYQSCTASNCHGQKSPTWGTAIPSTTHQCQKCHGSQTANSFVTFSGASVAPGTGNFDTNRVAGVTTRGGMHQEHLTASLGISAKIQCRECHTVHTTVNDATHLNYTTATLTWGALATDRGSKVPSISRSNGAITCNNTYCHTANDQAGSGPSPVWNNSGLLTGTIPGTGTGDCGVCHAFPPTNVTDHSGLSVTSLSNLAACSAAGTGCHGSLNAAPASYNTIFASTSLHINTLPGDDMKCLDCHSGIKAGTGTSAPYKRAAIKPQFASASHHVQKAGGAAVTEADCYVCHMEASNTGSINSTYHSKATKATVDLVIWSNGARSGSFIKYTANALNRNQAIKLNQFCLGCHSSAATQPTNPFGDGKNPNEYAWDSTKTGIADRYNNSGTTSWGAYSSNATNAKAKVNKSYSPHGTGAAANQVVGANQNDSITSTTINISGSVSVVCFDCHNSHGSASGNLVGAVTSSYSSATGRNKGAILKNITGGTGGYANSYKPTTHTAAANEKNSFNPGASLCFDCHNTRTNGTATMVAGKAPWGYNSTFNATQAINGYWDTPYFGNYTVPSAKRTAYKAGTNGAKSKPMGGHFTTSVAGLSVVTNGSGTNANQTTFSNRSKVSGICTPCHDPHGVSPSLGTNQTYAVPLLKGTWITSPYKEDIARNNVVRGGGDSQANLANGGAIPGYHIDQNTLLDQPAPYNGGASTATASRNARRQAFRNFSNSALKYNSGTTWGIKQGATQFAGLCTKCHNQTDLVDTVAPSSSNWKTKNRIHQSVQGWAATTGNNANNKIHAYTCSKCHAPHVSRLPRLMVTNCLDVNHKGAVASGGSVGTTAGYAAANTGNVIQSTVRPGSGRGAGRFPSGGARYTGSGSRAQNPGPWWFQSAQGTLGTAPSNGYITYPANTNCHNAANAGGTAFNPTNQRWNNRTPW